MASWFAASACWSSSSFLADSSLALACEVCVVLVEGVEGVPHRGEVVEGTHAQQDVEIRHGAVAVHGGSARCQVTLQGVDLALGLLDLLAGDLHLVGGPLICVLGGVVLVYRLVELVEHGIELGLDGLDLTLLLCGGDARSSAGAGRTEGAEGEGGP